jgi:hypothetical protein
MLPLVAAAVVFVLRPVIVVRFLFFVPDRIT